MFERENIQNTNSEDEESNSDLLQIYRNSLEEKLDIKSVRSHAVPGELNTIVSSAAKQHMKRYQSKIDLSDNILKRNTTYMQPATEGTNQNHKKSVIFAIIAALMFGIANFLMAEMSAKNGLQSLYPQSLMCIFLWTGYHSLKYFKYKRQKNQAIRLQNCSPGMNYQPSPHFMSRATSPYFRKARLIDRFQFNWAAFCVPILRSMISGWLQVIIILTFSFAAQSGINPGIISSIFSSCVVFTPIIFMFKHGQRISGSDVLGGIFIIICIVLIGAGPAIFGSLKGVTELEDDQKDTKQSQDQLTFLTYSIICALITGLTFSLNTLNVEYCISTVGFPPSQTNVDGQMLYGMVLLPVFIYEMCKEEKYCIFTTRDILMGNLSILCVTISITCFTHALKYGKGGVVQAIDSLKVIVQTVLGVILTGVIPSLVQMIGMFCGLVGVFIIIFQTKKPNKPIEQ